VEVGGHHELRCAEWIREEKTDEQVMSEEETEEERTRMTVVQNPSQIGEDRIEVASLSAEFHGP
jgi:hypothetical protein